MQIDHTKVVGDWVRPSFKQIMITCTAQLSIDRHPEPILLVRVAETSLFGFDFLWSVGAVVIATAVSYILFSELPPIPAKHKENSMLRADDWIATENAANDLLQVHCQPIQLVLQSETHFLQSLLPPTKPRLDNPDDPQTPRE